MGVRLTGCYTLQGGAVQGVAVGRTALLRSTLLLGGGVVVVRRVR